jgi:hypothetical protein
LNCFTNMTYVAKKAVVKTEINVYMKINRILRYNITIVASITHLINRRNNRHVALLGRFLLIPNITNGFVIIRT